MSAQLHALLAEERARDFAERPFADEPLISDMQCDAVDDCAGIFQPSESKRLVLVHCANCRVEIQRRLWWVRLTERKGFAAYCGRSCTVAAAKKRNAIKVELTVDLLRSLVHYDPVTGHFTRLVSKSHNAPIGSRAGTMSHGYWQLSVNGKTHFAHRLAWLYVHGSWPKHEVDHINHDKSDNRIANLRDVTPSVNQQNKRKAYSNNWTGFLGVKQEHSKFSARIQRHGKQTHLGMFDTPEEAHAAYLKAKRVMHEGNTL